MTRDLPGNWGTVRNAALERDSYSCRICGVSNGMRGIELHVHHLVPRERGGSNELRNLITVCRECHINIHHGNQTAPQEHVSTVDSILESIESYRWRSANLTNLNLVDEVARRVGGLMPAPTSIGNHLDLRSSIPEIKPRGFSDFLFDVRKHDRTEAASCST